MLHTATSAPLQDRRLHLEALPSFCRQRSAHQTLMEGQLLQLLGLLRVVMAWLHLRTVIYMEIFQLGRYANALLPYVIGR